jgi:hypothetical protein
VRGEWSSVESTRAATASHAWSAAAADSAAAAGVWRWASRAAQAKAAWSRARAGLGGAARALRAARAELSAVWGSHTFAEREREGERASREGEVERK